MRSKRITTLALLTASAMVLSACSSSKTVTTTAPDDTAAATETGQTEPSEATEPAATAFRAFASEDSSYSLIADGYGTQIRNQERGACFANATATAMESNYLMTTGETIEIDQNTIIYEYYGTMFDEEPDREGMHYTSVPYIEDGKWGLMAATVAANGKIDGLVLTSFWDLTDRPVSEIQDIIREHGAVAVAFSESTELTNTYGSYLTVNTPNEYPDHMLCFVGWDDDFPADYFDIPAESDGAWYAQNAFSQYWGNNGFYWISYETYTTEISSLQVSPDYTHVETYDNGAGETISTGASTTTANVYDYSGTIGAVGTFLMNEGESLHVDIYEGRFGELLYSQDETFTYSGYDTIVLDEPVEVDGEFTVAVTYDAPAPVDGQTRDVDNGAYFLVISEPGQSYVLIDGQWYDLTEQATADLLGNEFIANNACIKVLFED